MRGRPEGEGFQSPVDFRIQWSAKEVKEEAGWRMYNKKEKKEYKVAILKFVFLGVRSTVSGWDRIERESYYANIVQNIKNEKLTVKVKGPKGSYVFKTDYYENMKNELRRRGCKFASVIYAWMIGAQSKQLVEIVLQGAALNAWIDCKGGLNPEGNFIITSDDMEFVPRDGDKAAHWKPKFTFDTTDDKQLLEDAEKLALTVLGPYLDNLAGIGSAVAADAQADDNAEAVQAANAALNESRQTSQAATVVPEALDDDLPF